MCHEKQELLLGLYTQNKIFASQRIVVLLFFSQSYLPLLEIPNVSIEILSCSHYNYVLWAVKTLLCKVYTYLSRWNIYVYFVDIFYK